MSKEKRSTSLCVNLIVKVFEENLDITLNGGILNAS